MKKILSVLVSVILLFGCLAFTGCSAPNKRNVVGAYRFESLTAAGNKSEIVYRFGDNYHGTILSREYFCVTLESDGTASLTDNGATYEGTWDIIDGEVVVISGVRSWRFDYEKGKLTIDYYEGKILLIK